MYSHALTLEGAPLALFLLAQAYREHLPNVHITIQCPSTGPIAAGYPFYIRALLVPTSTSSATLHFRERPYFW